MKTHAHQLISVWLITSGGCSSSGLYSTVQYLGVLRGVDDVACPVHHPVHWDPRDDVGLDELQLIHELGRGSGELWLFQGRVKGLLPPHGLTD